MSSRSAGRVQSVDLAVTSAEECVVMTAVIIADHAVTTAGTTGDLVLRTAAQKDLPSMATTTQATSRRCSKTLAFII